jgi:hypothetical protein
MKKKITTTLNKAWIDWIESYIFGQREKGVSLKRNDVLEKALMELKKKVEAEEAEND